MCVNNLSYADDQVLITPDAKSMNALLAICRDFAQENYVTYSIMKTEAMLILPNEVKLQNPPDILLNGAKLNYVDQFRYLGHIITKNFSDDEDIERETRNLYIRGNTITRRFGFLSMDVKKTLFKSYCYPLYTCSLWSKYKQSSLNKLKVAYNSIMRKMVGAPPSYSLMCRVLMCCNQGVQAVLHSDSYTMSRTRDMWSRNLHVNPPLAVFML